MKINNFGKVNINPYQKQMDKIDSVQKTKKSDKVEISSEAKELQKGNAIEKERLEKVQALKNKVDSGDYQVNPRDVAKKMYDFWNM